MAMNLTSKKNIKDLLKKHSLQPVKRLGQHFLIDKKILRKIIRVANLKSEDIVLEVGPGTGNLTQELAKMAKKVVAIEKDPKMVEILKETLKNFKNVDIINTDILKINTKTLKTELPKEAKVKMRTPFSSPLKPKNYKIVANIPYYLTSPLIRKFLESGNPPKEMILMVQKEVAQRIYAKPPNMNLLAISVQFYAKPEIISYVSKKSFWPEPKINSAIIKIAPRQPAPYRNGVSGAGFRERFFRIVKAGFSQPRKQILNNLTKGLKLDKEVVRAWLEKNKISPLQRAETLTVKDWILLTKIVK